MLLVSCAPVLSLQPRLSGFYPSTSTEEVYRGTCQKTVLISSFSEHFAECLILAFENVAPLSLLRNPTFKKKKKRKKSSIIDHLQKICFLQPYPLHVWGSLSKPGSYCPAVQLPLSRHTGPWRGFSVLKLILIWEVILNYFFTFPSLLLCVFVFCSFPGTSIICGWNLVLPPLFL